MTVQTIAPLEACALLDAGALLIDIRQPDEHAREHIAGARCFPQACYGEPLDCEGRAMVFHCRGGIRTAQNADKLAQAAGSAPCYVIAGGIEGWRKAGLPTVIDRAAPLDIMRQVQIAAGSLVLAGVLLGWLVHPAFFVLAAFVGAGLTFAGVTGFCGMARLLAKMPWNRPLSTA